MKFLTNKLAFDLDYVKEVDANYDKNENVYKIKKDNQEYILEKANFLTFLRTFYFKETLFYILIFVFSIFWNKIFFITILSVSLFYFFIIKTDKEEIYFKNKLIINGIVLILTVITIVMGAFSFFNPLLFNYAIISFLMIYLFIVGDSFVKIYSVYNDSVYTVRDENFNKIKGYMAWKKE